VLLLVELLLIPVEDDDEPVAEAGRAVSAIANKAMMPMISTNEEREEEDMLVGRVG
jgi:hypothetical protein